MSYKVAFTITLHLISHLYHDKISLHKYFVKRDASFYVRLNPLIFFIVSLNSAACLPTLIKLFIIEKASNSDEHITNTQVPGLMFHTQ